MYQFARRRRAVPTRPRRPEPSNQTAGGSGTVPPDEVPPLDEIAPNTYLLLLVTVPAPPGAGLVVEVVMVPPAAPTVPVTVPKGCATPIGTAMQFGLPVQPVSTWLPPV